MPDPTVSEDPRRNYPRIELPKGPSVAWRGGGKVGVGHVTSMSLGGLFISIPDPPDSGSVVQLLFDIQHGEVRARAVVKRSVPGMGMGVQFINMGYEDRGRLYQLLKKLL